MSSGWGDSNAQSFGDWGSATSSVSVPAAASWESKPAAPAVAPVVASDDGWNNNNTQSKVTTFNNNSSSNGFSNNAASFDDNNNNASSGWGAASAAGWGSSSSAAPASTTSDNNAGWGDNANDSSRSARYYNNDSVSAGGCASSGAGGYQRNQSSSSGGYQRAFEPHERPGRSRRPAYESPSPIPYNSSNSTSYVPSPYSGTTGGEDDRPRGPRKIMGISIDEFPSATTMLDPVGPPRERRSNNTPAGNGYSSGFSRERPNDYCAPAESAPASTGSWDSVPTPNPASEPAASSGAWSTSVAAPAAVTISSGWGDAIANNSSGWGNTAAAPVQPVSVAPVQPVAVAPVQAATFAAPVSSSGWDAAAPVSSSGWNTSSTWEAKPTAESPAAAIRDIARSGSVEAPPKPADSFPAQWQSKSPNNLTDSISPSAANPVTTTTTNTNTSSIAYANVTLPANSSWATCPFCHNCFVHPPVPTNSTKN